MILHVGGESHVVLGFKAIFAYSKVVNTRLHVGEDVDASIVRSCLRGCAPISTLQGNRGTGEDCSGGVGDPAGDGRILRLSVAESTSTQNRQQTPGKHLETAYIIHFSCPLRQRIPAK